jgi:hypothetical protein
MGGPVGYAQILGIAEHRLRSRCPDATNPKKGEYMMRVLRPAWLALAAIALSTGGAANSFAQGGPTNGKLKIHVRPKQAYVFVDGKAFRDGQQTISLSVGTHSIGIYNYGYAPKTQDVNITAGKTTDLDVSLQASGEKVSGPFGDIELNGHPRAAVLLNGDTPKYFVGHVDEFDNNFIWHQWLLVKPGTYQLMATEKGQTVWSGPLTVKAGQRIIVDLNHNGQLRTRDFKKGLTLPPQQRFGAGVATAEVPVASPTAELSASQSQTTCGQSADLKWKATDVADTTITDLGNVPETGDRSVNPTQNTTYQPVAKGPGGEATRSVTIDVNSQPVASLSLSQPQIEYHKIGDKVVEQGSTTLNWSASNGERVTITPLGSVSDNGSRKIEATPGRTDVGAIKQDITYTMNVSNACGGTATRTATLHIVGSVDPAPSVVLASVFYPTAYPERRRPRVGLISSEEKTLAKVAGTFMDNVKYDSQSKLMVVGLADTRGPQKYNLELSGRRAQLVKNYLISQGVPADKIETKAEGKEHPLTEAQVSKLLSEDQQQLPKFMTAQKQATWLAYNRRVDIILEPTGQQSAEVYPTNSTAARILWERPVPSLKAVEAISRPLPLGTESSAAR